MSVYCQSCGNELPQQVKFCPRCGVSVSPDQSPGNDVMSTEPLFAQETATVQQGTEALVPNTEELPVASPLTGKISQPATAALKSQKEVVAIPTAAIRPKPGSPMKLAAFAGFFLLAAVAAAGIYFSTGKSPSTSANPVSTPNTIPQPTPSENQQPVNAATPAEPQTSPTGTAAKPTEKNGEVADAKSKSITGSADGNSTAKSAVPATASAADHIKLGLSAGSPSEALVAYKRAQQIDPANMDVHYLMGLAYQQLGQPDQALTAYRKCTSGTYASVAAQHVKKLEKDLSKSKY